MAGFYGNIRNSTSNSFKFDRVYSNRKIMDLSADNDGVFAGRYVLVEYDQDLTKDLKIGDSINGYVAKAFYQFNDDGKYYTYEPNVVLATDENGINSYSLVKKDSDQARNIYSYDETTLILEIVNVEIAVEENYEAAYREEDGYYVCILSETEYNGMKFDKPYRFDYYEDAGIFKGELVLTKDITTKIVLQDEEEQTDITIYDDPYTTNYEIDKYYYGLGRGYDSTVWRKVYQQDGSAKYVNVAELNSVIPTFAVSPDEPTDNPIPPHFDKDSTNVYYNLHLQVPWGFRIAPLEETDKIKTSYDVNNDDIKEIKEYPNASYKIIEYNEDGTVDRENHEYPGAIYINKRGFDWETHYGPNTAENKVELTNSGSSGLIYNHNNEPQKDIKELSIILPVLGNTVSEMYDLMYGNGDGTDGSLRNNTIVWEDANGKGYKDRLRLVTGDADDIGYYYTPIDYPDSNDSNPNIDSLAGAINSIHDIMGMIITKEYSPPEMTQQDITNLHLYKPADDDDIYLYNAFTNQIYVEENEKGTHDFYYAAKTNGYREVDMTESDILYQLGVIEGHEGETYDGYEKIEPRGLLKNYKDVEEKQYIREAEYTLSLHDDTVAQPGAQYYNLPKKLKYAGVLAENGAQIGNTYFIRDDDDYVAVQCPQYKVSTDNTIIADKKYFILLDTGIYTDCTNAVLPAEMREVLLDYYNQISLLDITDEEREARMSAKETELRNTYLATLLQNDELYEIDEDLVYYSIQNYYQVNSSEEPFFASGVTYYTYNEYKNLYSPIDFQPDDEHPGDGIDSHEKRWSEYVQEGKLYRDSHLASGAHYLIFRNDANTFYIKRTKYVNGQVVTKLVNGKEVTEKKYYAIPMLSPAPSKLKDLQNYVNNLPEVINDNNEAVTYNDPSQKTGWVIEARDCIRIKSIAEPDETESETTDSSSTTTDYDLCKIYQFLFDSAPLYEYDGINRKYVRADFGDNSTGGTIGTASNKIPFYRITARSVKRYEDNRYCVFKSSDPDIGNRYVKIEDENDPNNLVIIEARNIENGIIDTENQSITKFWLSRNGFDNNVDYWEILDDEDEHVYSPNEIRNYFNETGIVAYGINDINIDDESYRQKAINNTLDLYYADNVLYKKNVDVYEIATLGEDYNPSTDELYKERKLCIIGLGSFEGKFKLYQEWNPLVIQSRDDYDYYFNPNASQYFEEGTNHREGRYVSYLGEWQQNETYYELINDEYVATQDSSKQPNKTYYIYKPWEPLVLGKKVNILVKRRLPGFARTLNTIHGLLLKINELLQIGDLKTRDLQTVQGCINQMHDIFEKFGELSPNEILGVNKFGKFAAIGFESEKDGESWIDLGTKDDDENIDKRNLYSFHKTINDFIRYVVTEDQAPQQDKTYYIRDEGEFVEYTAAEWDPNKVIYEERYSEDDDRNADIIDFMSDLQDELIDGDAIHAPFGYTNQNSLQIASPTIDNAGHVVGLKNTEVLLADLLLKSGTLGDGETVIATLNSPNGPVNITTEDTLLEGMQTIATYINQGASNITIDNDYPYVITQDETPQAGKTYYIKQNNEFVEYTGEWTDGLVIYEKIDSTDAVSGGDSLVEAIAKLQNQIDDHKENQLTISGTGDIISDLSVNDGEITATKSWLTGKVLSGFTQGSDSSAIAATDTVGQALSKLQMQVTNISTNYSGIVRRALADGVPTTNPNAAGYTPGLNSGWIWVDTTVDANNPNHHYVYIKTAPGYKTESFTDAIDQNYWELLNAWQ